MNTVTSLLVVAVSITAEQFVHVRHLFSRTGAAENCDPPETKDDNRVPREGFVSGGQTETDRV